MIDRFERTLRKFRHWLSRSEWGIRLLGLSRSVGTASEPGLVMIQIDGLSRTQLEAALKKKRMPFLEHLLRREGYHLHSLYTGLPASTPSVQGELFYGVKTAVPAFSFMNRKTGEVVQMFDPAPAQAIQEQLEKHDPGLLQEGSSYTNIYSGGASESHYCPATFGRTPLRSPTHKWALSGFIFFYFFRLLRTAGLLLVESVLAVVDFIRGLIDGKNLWKELKFVPTRVAISILLRDLATIGACIDVTRGLPVVHLNFLGYDEQAHRRGPSSHFAHWTLKGIDNAIRQIYHAARRSPRRDYDIWIYSDHGQEPAVPYPEVMGQSIQEAVTGIFNQYGKPHVPDQDKRGVQFLRSKWLGTRFLNWLLGDTDDSALENKANVLITAAGPMGHVYTPERLRPKEQEQLAVQLVGEAGIPLVLARGKGKKAVAWTPRGRFSLPEDAALVLGNPHPFLHETAHDLAALCHHPHAGDLLISGWNPGNSSLSFPNENGSHAGPGSEETHAFALLPITAPVTWPEERTYLKPQDLRNGALHLLGRKTSPQQRKNLRPRRHETALRVMSYNVHSCLGMDGKLSPSRIARIIAHYDPDIVCLQELDVGRLRTGSVDQAHFIARELEMEFHFFPALEVEEELYGDAILSRYPMHLVRAGRLPSSSGITPMEPRGALWTSITIGDQEIQLINTHFGLRPGEGPVQAEALLGDDWLGHPQCRAPIIVCGDLNVLPRSKVYRKLRRRLKDTQLELPGHRPKRTFFGRYPVSRIDYIFVSPEITVHSVEVPRSALTRVASDHLPIVAELSIPKKPQPAGFWEAASPQPGSPPKG